jgi:hypothetical protein
MDELYRTDEGGFTLIELLAVEMRVDNLCRARGRRYPNRSVANRKKRAGTEPALFFAPINPSAWKGYSANFAQTEFSEVELLLSRVLIIGTPFAPPPHLLRYPPEGARSTSS